MNIGQIKTKAIQLIREFSNNGNLITETDNADYLLSMNSFINDAQFDLCSIRPIIKKATLSTPIEVTDAFKKYSMPSDYMGFKELKKGDFHFADFDWEGKLMVISAYYDDTYTLLYYAFPSVIDNTTADSTELEIDLDMQMVIPYYVAGHVIINENKDLADYLLAEYEAKKKKTTIPSVMTIENVFGW